MPFSKSAPLSRLIGLITRNVTANLITRNITAKRVRFVLLTFFFAVVLSSLPVHLKHDGASAESRRPRRTQGLASRNLPDLGETNGNAASRGSRNEPGLNGPSPIAVQSGGVVTLYPSSYQTPAAGGGEAVDSQINTGHGSTTSTRQIWTRTVNFAQGIYRFSATVDNGVRLYVDGYLRIDQWANLPPNTYTADVATHCRKSRNQA